MKEVKKTKEGGRGGRIKSEGQGGGNRGRIRKKGTKGGQSGRELREGTEGARKINEDGNARRKRGDKSG